MQRPATRHIALVAVLSAAALAGAAIAQSSSPANSPTGATNANKSSPSVPSTTPAGGTTAGSTTRSNVATTTMPDPAAGARSSTATTSAMSDKSSAKLARADRDFAMKAAQAGRAEVDAGKLAAGNAANAEVKKFGEHMAQDHSKANDELMQIAQSKGFTLPSEPDRSHQRFAKQLQGMSGDRFDRTYMREAGVKDHKNALALFSNEAKKGKDPELRAYAQKILPDIQEHLKTAQQISASGKQ